MTSKGRGTYQMDQKFSALEVVGYLTCHFRNHPIQATKGMGEELLE